jgi:hypothetical protein
VSQGHGEAVSLLLRRGADARKWSDDAKILPLWQAAAKGQTDIVSRLIAGGAKVNEQSEFSAYCPTALLAACRYGHVDTVRALLTAGADVNLRGSMGMSVVGTAAAHGQWECAAAVLKHFPGKASVVFALHPSLYFFPVWAGSY